ncbi:MAG: lipid A biosynthesis acyltransferase [Chitinophagales bacterium]
MHEEVIRKEAREWEGKSKGMPLGYRIFVWLMRTAGLYPAYFLLVFVAFYYFLFSRETSRHSYCFFRKRMHFSALKSRWKVYVSYFMIGQVIIDKVAIMSGMAKNFSSTSTGSENLKQIVREGKGGILLGAHLGNWEIAGQFLLNYDGVVNIVMYEGEEAQIKQYLESVTGKRRFNVIPVKPDLSHVYLMSEALQRGELICMHADRFMEGNRTMAIPFLGSEALFPAGPFQLVRSLKAPFTYVYGVKTGPMHYDFFARPLRDARNFASVKAIMEDYAHDLEGMVRLHPEQWFNYYDFWKQ